eukprot:Skav216517  [mRNA]  locus=scaffold4485:39961:44081:+ [translate_table: standard]
MFVLISPELVPYFTGYQNVEKFMFAQHPVVEANFNIGKAPLTKQIWNLPRSMDEHMFDEQLLEDAAQTHCSRREEAFQTAFNDEDVDEALRQFALAYDETHTDAAVTTDGARESLQADCLKRCTKRLKKLVNISAPIVKHARQGDFQVEVAQISIKLRRWIKQVRRLQSLQRQLQVHEKKPTENNKNSCWLLWMSISTCNGFPGGFHQWCMQQFGVYVPQGMPHSEYVGALAHDLQEVVQQLVWSEHRAHWKKFQKLTLDDIAKGGRKAYQSVTRPHWDLEAFDVQMFANDMAKRETRQVGILQALAAGRHVTNDGLKHYAAKEFNGKCQLCGAQDSKTHRFFQCCKLQHVRDQFKDVYKWLPNQPDAVFAFGIASNDNEPMLLKVQLEKEIQFQLPADDDKGVSPHVFTDGTCYFGTMWDCALAGASVIEADVDARTAREVNRFILPSWNHNAFRAESYAILDALNRYYRCTLVVDCQAAINLLRHFQDCCLHGTKVLPSHHGRLWDCIAQHVVARPPDAIQVLKTKAHTDWKCLPEGREQFFAYCNDLADRAAKQCKSVRAPLDLASLSEFPDGSIHSSFLDSFKGSRIESLRL